MPTHEYFEELCALEPMGQLSDQEHQELAEHLKQCASCRQAGEEFAFILDQLPAAVLPKTNGDTEGLLSESYRQKFLEKASAEGLRFSSEAVDRHRAVSFFPAFRRHRSLGIVAIAAICLALYFSFIFRKKGKDDDQPDPARDKTSQLHKPAPLIRTQPSIDATKVRELEQQIALLEQRQIELLEEKQNIQAEPAKLREELDNAISRSQSLSSRLEQSGKELSDAKEELTKLKNAEAGLLADLANNATKVQELQDKVAEDESALNRERELNAVAKDIRRLMAARNVHIVDVYDYDTRGRRDKSFGRIVYTEGESLIFYAFDLGKADSGSKVTFQAWGQREGVSTIPRNLGVFDIDDHEQRRWVLRVDDPKLLSSIDSVFVTVEPSPGRSKPSGKKLLYAFLGMQPNHP